MIENHSLSYQNIVSKYYRFLPENIEEAFIDLRDIITKQGCHPAGALFFSVLSEPTEEIMLAEIFMSIEENHVDFPEEEDVKFRSYFNIKPMLMTRIRDDFYHEAQVKYGELHRYIEEHQLTDKTPIFMELKLDNEGNNYLEMSIGIKANETFFQ